MRRIGQWAGRLALVAASLLVFFLAAEVWLRVEGKVVPPLRVRDAKIGEHYLTSFDERIHSGESGRRVRLRFNALGFRGPDALRALPAQRRRVAVLGDSMVAALAVEEEETMVARLAAALTERDDEPWDALNFGVSASSPGQALVLHREIVSAYRSDVVVLAFFVGNDLSDSSKELDAYPRIYFELEDGELVEHGLSAGRSSSSAWLNRNSRFYVWQKRTINGALHATWEHTATLPPGWWIYSNDPPPPVVRAWEVLARVFAAFREQVEATGARFVVAVLPTGRQIYPDRFEAVTAFEGAADFTRDAADARIAATCERAKTQCVFLRPAFEAAARGLDAEATEEDDLLFFHGTGHFTPRGHALAADVLAPALVATSSSS